MIHKILVNINMNTIIWGNSAWQFFHIHSLIYKPRQETIQNLYDFYSSLDKILPCKYCKINYKKHTNGKISHDIFKSKDNYSKWLFNLHNSVNDTLREMKLKSVPNPEYKDILEYYKKLYKEYKKENVFIGFDFINSVLYNLQKNYKDRSNVILFLQYIKNLLFDFNIPIMTDYCNYIDIIISELNNNKDFDTFINNYFNKVIICANNCSKKCVIQNYNTLDFVKFYKNQQANCSKTLKTCRK